MARGLTGFMAKKPGYGEMGSQATIDSAKNDANTAMNNARTSDAVMSGMAKVESAGHWADAIRAKGAAAGQQSMVSGITGGISSLAGGIGKSGGLFGGSGGGSSDFGLDIVNSNPKGYGAFDLGGYDPSTSYF